MAAVESTIREFNIQPRSQVLSVGQLVSIVVAAATILRGVWLFLRMFVGPNSRFVWPFAFNVVRELWIVKVLEEDGKRRGVRLQPIT